MFDVGDVQDKGYGPMVYSRLRDQWRKMKSSWGTKSKVSMMKFFLLSLFGFDTLDDILGRSTCQPRVLI